MKLRTRNPYVKQLLRLPHILLEPLELNIRYNI